MHFGYYISGFAHLGLLMGLLIGPIFQKDVEPVAVSYKHLTLPTIVDV